MRFLYKINSGYGGPGGRFTPSKIGERLIDGQHLLLGWTRYLEAVDEGDRVWVYFKGPQQYQPGVYAWGYVAKIDEAEREVMLRVTNWSDRAPLTDPETGAFVARAVAQWYEQVFVLPEGWANAPTCSVDTTAASCRERKCEWCGTWRSLPLIDPATHRRPRRLTAHVAAFAPAYWVVPPRAFLTRDDVISGIRNTTDLFKSFKAGRGVLAHPLALGMYEALHRRGLVGENDYDAIVPVPLSPEKMKRGENHRTRLLADELSQWIAAPVAEWIDLDGNVSKRTLIAQGYTQADFEAIYASKLVVSADVQGAERVLLVDDVCTHGSTLRTIAKALRRVEPSVDVVTATAGLMVVKPVVADAYRLVR